jgi:gamma-glutamyltranspeptidase/glutathione hydrolase
VVPGYVAGLYELHRRHGSLPWERVVDTAPEAMENVTMHHSLASAIEKSRDLLAADPGAEYIYLSQRPGAPTV